ncbi:MAG: sigma-70 family RNA polymerase sigma factor [Saprospiraceae bacterium]
MIQSDSSIVASIKGTEEQRKEALRYFFQDMELRNSIIHYVHQNGGKMEDGEDVFQDTVILFDRNIRQDKFTFTCTLRTYFFAIAKWRWVSLRRKKENNTLEFKNEFIEGSQESPEAEVFENEKRDILKKAISSLGDRCQKILKWYKLDFSMKEIAEKAGLSSDQMAKKETYRCRERLKKVFMENQNYLEILQIKLPNGRA